MMAYRRQADAPPVVTGDRTVSFVLSTNGVKRDGNTINQSGWLLDPYLQNPIVTFAHDTMSPPIARMVTIGVRDGALQGTALFADADTNPAADTIYRCIQQKFLNAASIAWSPIEARYATDKGRLPGSIDFIKQELLECSIVPLPSDPACLVTARSFGIDTRPIADLAEQLLSQRGDPAIPRATLQAMARNGKKASAVYDFAKRGTRADRAKLARFMAYDGARRLGASVPPCFLPARSREEREAIVAGYTIRQREEFR